MKKDGDGFSPRVNSNNSPKSKAPAQMKSANTKSGIKSLKM